MAVFDRDDIVLVPLDPRGTRLTLDLTAKEFNKLGNVLIAPITTQTRGATTKPIYGAIGKQL